MPRVDFSPKPEVIPEKIVEEEAGEFKQRQRRRSSIAVPIITNIRRGSNISIESCTCTTSMYVLVDSWRDLSQHVVLDAFATPTLDVTHYIVSTTVDFLKYLLF